MVDAGSEPTNEEKIRVSPPGGPDPPPPLKNHKFIVFPSKLLVRIP